MGDLNDIMNQSEKHGGRKVTQKSNFLLKKFLDQVEGMDIGYTGNTFTWCNKKGGMTNIRERLDKVIGSVDWRIMFANAGVMHLNASSSDHAPILLNLNLDHHSLPKSFRFLEIWTRDQKCYGVINEAWNMIEEEPSRRISIGQRLTNMTKEVEQRQMWFCSIKN